MANKENLAPNRRRSVESATALSDSEGECEIVKRCKMCANLLPVIRICETCGEPNKYVCDGEDCWRTRVGPASSKLLDVWTCHECIDLKDSHVRMYTRPTTVAEAEQRIEEAEWNTQHAKKKQCTEVYKDETKFSGVWLPTTLDNSPSGSSSLSETEAPVLNPEYPQDVDVDDGTERTSVGDSTLDLLRPE